ncbi:hypothetical protein [Legionella sp. CNM-4043-24]|uniref:hypothetical protein n=1 Tax=Legionella sp. CNM-4043-24 TaxID=3421646 RepID=UPI00403ADCF1
MMEFTGEQFQFKGDNQKIMIDMLLQLDEFDLNRLALALNVSIDQIEEIYNDTNYLDDQQTENLAQIFLRLIGRTFFHKFSITRHFRQP